MFLLQLSEPQFTDVERAAVALRDFRKLAGPGCSHCVAKKSPMRSALGFCDHRKRNASIA